MIIFDWLMQGAFWYQGFLANNGLYKWEVIHILNIVACFTYYRCARDEIESWFCNILLVPPVMLACVTIVVHKPIFILSVVLCILLFSLVAYAAINLNISNEKNKLDK